MSYIKLFKENCYVFELKGKFNLEIVKRMFDITELMEKSCFQLQMKDLVLGLIKIMKEEFWKEKLQSFNEYPCTHHIYKKTGEIRVVKCILCHQRIFKLGLFL